ncbi:MAG: hypothetical protein ACAH80_10110 [Alphaproteobacteria bacterium]
MTNISAEVSDAFARKDAPAGRHFHTYCDGSGSFSAQRLRSGNSVFDLANDAIERLAPKTGQKVEALFWGEPVGTYLIELGANTPKNIMEKLMLGTSLAPAVKEMQIEASQPGQHHFLIYSDGDLGDYNDSRDAFRALLSTRKNATVDVIVCCERPGSWMQEIATMIAGEFPGQMRVTQISPEEKGSLYKAADAVVTARLSEPPYVEPTAAAPAKTATPGQKA